VVARPKCRQPTLKRLRVAKFSAWPIIYVRTGRLVIHGHSIMHCKAPVWVKPNLGEAQLGHQASAEYKLRFYLGLRHVYFGAVYSAGSETERVALKKRSETQNRSTIQIVTTKYVSAPAQCHARHPQHHQTPPRAAGLTRARTGMHPLQQGPSRQGWQTELQQQAALQRQAARRQPAGRSGWPFRTPTADCRRREGPQGRARPGR
jgi:hypothetical protein